MFTLIAGITNGEDALDVVDRLHGRIDDVLVSAQDNTLFLEFDREATGIRDLIRAIHEVEAAQGIEVTSIDNEELVNAAEIAHRVGRSRESVRLLIAARRGPGSFPQPIYRSGARDPLWQWADVAAWFHDRLGTNIDVPDTQPGRAVTAALVLRRAERSFSARDRREVEKLVGV